MVVSLHPFSTGRDAWRERSTGGRRETFETDEKIEIACVLSIENWKLKIPAGEAGGGHEDESRR
jgi:hypothetical protein